MNLPRLQKIIPSLLFLMIPCLTYAQMGKIYRGTINYKIKITLYLEGMDEGTNADPITASYKYDAGKGYILLNGHKNNNGNISLVELSSVNFTGTFVGTVKGAEITGRWISADQKIEYHFKLTESPSDQAQINRFRNETVNKASNLRTY